MSNKTEAPKGETPKSDAGKGSEAPAAAPSGGAKAWLPLVLAVVLMPALAWVTTSFVIVPKVLKARETPESPAEEHEPGKEVENGGDHGGQKKEGKESKESPNKGKKKQTYQVSKLIVNVAGSMGTRYL